MTGSTSMPWVKLHTAYLEDIRFAGLSVSPKCLWFELLMLAGKLDAGGFFFEAGKELSDEQIAWKLRLELKSFQSDAAQLESASLLHRNGRGWCIPGFEEDQGPAQADKRAAWKDRQSKHRNSHAAVTRDNTMTNTNVTPTEESRGDKEERRGEEPAPSAPALFSIPGPEPTPATEPEKAVVSSETDMSIKQVSYSGYTKDVKIKIPETPAEAASDPIIGLFEQVTGRLPGVSQYKTVIETILFVRTNKTGPLQSVVDYLKPYWLAWSGRKSQAGKPYSLSNLTWLTEWAVNASIPPIGGERPSDNIVRPPSVEETKKMLAEREKKIINPTPPTPLPSEVREKLQSLTKKFSAKR